MAFLEDGTDGDKIRHSDEEGLWALRDDTAEYSAWRAWLMVEFGKRAFTQWLTATGRWPPTTQRGADAYATWLSKIRDSKYGKEQQVVSTVPVPRHPQPWLGELT